jgi:hypothetical protein
MKLALILKEKCNGNCRSTLSFPRKGTEILGSQQDGSTASAEESTSGRHPYSRRPGESRDMEGVRDYYNSHEVRQTNNQQLE